MTRAAYVCTTQIIVFIEARTEVVESVGVISSMIDSSVAVRIAGCAVGAIDTGEASRLARETCLCGVVIIVAGDAPT